MSLTTNEKRGRGRTLQPFINVTPLIDVLLVLLIIFMVISPARPSRFETKIPEKNESPIEQENPFSLVVTVNRAGEYALNQQPASSLSDLQSLLLGALNGRPADQKTVFIKAPRALRYGDVVKVVDVAKAAGSAPIGLQLEQLEP